MYFTKGKSFGSNNTILYDVLELDEIRAKVLAENWKYEKSLAFLAINDDGHIIAMKINLFYVYS